VLTYDGTQWTPAAVTQATGNYITKITGDLISSAYSSGTVTGTLASVALPGTSTKVTYDAKGRITSGTSLSASDIPPLSASVVTSGTLSVANGGTGADLSTTGGAGQYLKQSTVGGAVSVGAIAASEITASLGFTPVNRAGDTLAGGLNAGGFDLSNTGNIQMAASKTLALSTNTSDRAPTASNFPTVRPRPVPTPVIKCSARTLQVRVTSTAAGSRDRLGL